MSRGAAIQEAARAAGRSRAVMYPHLRRYWQYGQNPDALLPDYHLCGGRGKIKSASLIKRGHPRHMARIDNSYTGMNVTEEVRSIIVDAGKKYYEVKKLSLTRAYKEMIAESFSDVIIEGKDVIYVPYSDDRRPTQRQFAYWYRFRRDSTAGVYARVGDRRSNLLHRVALGSSTDDVFGPGSMYQVDATVGDIYLLSRLVPISGRVLSSLLFGVSPIDPVSLVLATTVLLAVGLGAAYAPASRASRIDPMEVLRSE